MIEPESKNIKDISFLKVFAISEIWPCYIAIFFALYSIMGISATITVHLTQDYGYDLHIAYYFFATWSTGQTVGNCFSPCMIPYTRPLLKIAMVG